MGNFKTKGKSAPKARYLIKYFDHPDDLTRYINDGGGRTFDKALKIAQSNLLKDNVEWAILYENEQITKYHHHKAPGGIKTELTKFEYAALTRDNQYFSLWIVPTTSARREGKKADRVNGVQQDDIPLYEEPGVKYIDIYSYGKLVARYERGKYKEL